jgi:hypothetical protein
VTENTAKELNPMMKSFGAKTLIYPTPVWCVGSYDAAGKPDIGKIRPLVFAPEARSYYGVGDCVGKAFEIGKKG